ncbi:MAG: serine hydrolase domain-containing protein [Bryobacteraceae bacterium]|jgi:CubicO group peptidase (beta-lactamase class C family)
MTRRHALPGAVFLACVAASALAAQVTPQQSELIASLVAKFLAVRPSPAVSVAVWDGQGPIWTRAWGKADLENDVPATPRSAFRLASISKPFTAVAVLRLVELGKLSLDAPVQKYLPKYPRKKWSITIRQLLCHQSGVRHNRATDYDNTRHFASPTESLEVFAKDPLLFEPGTHTLYSTFGYVLLGAIMEAVTGKPYADFVRDEVLLPARIETMRSDDVFAIVPHRVSGYRLRKDGTVENCSLVDTSHKTPGGGWLGTAEDPVRLARALLRGRILKDDTRTLMWTPQRLKNGALTGFGLGWDIAEEHGLHVIEKSGGQQGTNTHLVIAPDRNLAVSVLLNLEDGGARKLALDILAALASPAAAR